jgi:hypothetical protein
MGVIVLALIVLAIAASFTMKARATRRIRDGAAPPPPGVDDSAKFSEKAPSHGPHDSSADHSGRR